MKPQSFFYRAGVFVVALLLAFGWQTATAGTRGSMINAYGRGVAVNSVVLDGVTNTAKSPLMQNPNSAVTFEEEGNWEVRETPPEGAAKEVFSQSYGNAPGVWTWQAYVMDGATADNPELTSKLPVAASGFAKYDVKSKVFFDADNNVGYIALEGFATKGAGVWLRCIEFKGDGEPADLADLLANGDLKLEVTLAGPFFFDPTNCTDVKIPFTFKRTTNEVYFVADGVALSIPFTITSPDVTGECGVPVFYPAPVISGGSGTNELTYDPPTGSTFGYGESIVKVVVKDLVLGISKTNSFKVTVDDTTNPEITCPAPIVTTNDLGQCSATVSIVPPTATDNCLQSVTGVRDDALALNAPYPKGVTKITWTATDTKGNSTSCEQTITVQDKEKPVVTVPSNISVNTDAGKCSAVVAFSVSATDNCPGVTVGTDIPSGTAFAKGTTTVSAMATDAAGNQSVKTFTVTVTDLEKPVKPTLPTVTGSCLTPVTLMAPTTTDNCTAIVTGTTLNPTTYSVPGTNTVLWTFTDAAGNSITANQTVIVPSPVFDGFYINSSLSCQGGSCGSPVRTHVCGGAIPVSFKLTCGGSPITTGTIPLTIEKSNSSCTSLGTPTTGNFTYSNGQWRFNWNTSSQSKGTYKLTATLPNGTKKVVWVKLTSSDNDRDRDRD